MSISRVIRQLRMRRPGTNPARNESVRVILPKIRQESTTSNGGTGSLVLTPLSSAFFVDMGTASTSPDGSIQNPFPTVQEAVTAVPIGSTLLITPGDYNEEVVIPSGRRLTLAGLGEGVRIRGTNGPGIYWAPTDQDILTLKDLELDNSQPSFAFVAEGDGVLNQATLVAENCRFLSLAGASIQFLSTVQLSECEGRVTYLNCSQGLNFGHENGSCRVIVDDPVPAAVSLNIHLFKSCTFDGGIDVVANANVLFDGECSSPTLTTTLGAGTIGPLGSLQFEGKASFGYLIIDDGVVDRIKLPKARFDELNLVSTATVNVPYVNAEGANITELNMVDAGSEFVLNNKGGSIGSLSASSFGLDCRVLRDRGSAVILVAPGANAYTFQSLGGTINGPAYPTGIFPAPTFVLTPNVFPGAATDVMAITANSADGCTIESGYVGPVNVFIEFGYPD